MKKKLTEKPLPVWQQAVIWLIVISTLLGCGGTTAVTPAVERVPEAQTAETTTDNHTSAVSNMAQNAENTPTPDFLIGAELVPTPVAAPVAPGSEIYRRYDGPSVEEIQHLQQTQGWVMCPEEQVVETETGVGYICPGIGADMPTAIAVFAPAGVLAFSDTPAPGPGDAAAVLYVLVSAAVVVQTGQALSQMPRVLMARNPNTLPDVVVPPGIAPPTPHIENHPSGAFASKLKSLAWVQLMVRWFDFANNGGEPPDYCGVRPEDGALLIVYYGLKISTLTGRAYEGFAAIVNMGSDAHDSTVLIKLQRPADGQSHTSNNTGRDDFSEFDPIDPQNCPPPPTPFQIAR